MTSPGASEHPLARLFSPESVALVGASSDPTKLSGRPLRYLRSYGYAGRVYPVNPRYRELDGLPCYPTVEALPEAVDLALILSPAESVPELAEACGARGVRFAIVIASGFAEAGNPAGQGALQAVAQGTGMRIVGPNCVGLLSTASNVTATFSTVLQRAMVAAGPISVVSQSGALANSLLQSLQAMGLGVRHWISLGNEADLSALEVLEFLADDPGTRTVLLFVEAFKHGQHLVEAGRRARAAGKVVLLLRGGQSEAGRRASQSHTGKLASAAAVGRALAHQAGIVQVDTMAELLDTLQVAAVAEPAPVLGLGVLTVSGGQGVLIGDAASRHNVPLTELAPETRRRLAELLPPALSGRNPVDVALLGSNDRYFACAQAVLEDPGTSHLLWVLSSLANRYRDLLAPLIELAARAQGLGKPLLLSYLSPYDRLPLEEEASFHAAGGVILPYAEQAVAALGRLNEAGLTRAEGGGRRAKGEGERLLGTVRTGLSEDHAGEGWGGGVPERVAGTEPPWMAVEELLRRSGIATPGSRLVATPAEAAEATLEIGLPVALKVVAPSLAHKTEAGAVRLGLTTSEEVRRTADAMLAGLPEAVREAGVEGILVQQMVAGGVEVIVGVTWDPEFGPILTIGAGGMLAELVRDTAWLGLPATEREVRSALDRTRVARLLAGFRGAPPMDRDALVGAAVALAELYARERWIGEIELNPLAVLPAGQGAVALDVLVVSADG